MLSTNRHCLNWWYSPSCFVGSQQPPAAFRVVKIYSPITDIRIVVKFCFKKVLKYNQTTNTFFLYRPTHHHSQQNCCLFTIDTADQTHHSTSSPVGSINCSAALLTLSAADNLRLLCISSISTQYLPVSISIYCIHIGNWSLQQAKNGTGSFCDRYMTCYSFVPHRQLPCTNWQRNHQSLTVNIRLKYTFIIISVPQFVHTNKWLTYLLKHQNAFNSNNNNNSLSINQRMLEYYLSNKVT